VNTVYLRFDQKSNLVRTPIINDNIAIFHIQAARLTVPLLTDFKSVIPKFKVFGIFTLTPIIRMSHCFIFAKVLSIWIRRWHSSKGGGTNMSFNKKVIFLILSLSYHESGMAESIVLSSMNYPPFYGEEMPNKGPLIEIITQAFKLVGYDTHVVFSPWKRAILSAKKGRTVDGMVGVWHNEDRAKDFLYSKPIYPNRVGFYKHKDREIEYQSYADLANNGYTLGSVRGYILPEGLKESGIKIENVTDDIQNLKKLSLKRVDLVVIDKDFAHYALKSLPNTAQAIEWLEPTLSKLQQYLIVSRKTRNSHKKMQDFNRGLALLKEKGEFNAIIKKHGLTP